MIDEGKLREKYSKLNVHEKLEEAQYWNNSILYWELQLLNAQKYGHCEIFPLCREAIFDNKQTVDLITQLIAEDLNSPSIVERVYSLIKPHVQN